MEHVISQGECLSSIAHHYGFTDWRVIYHDPSNAEFKRKRPNPNLIFPRDVIVIPERELKQVLCATDQRHRFQVTYRPTYVHIRLVDPNDEPIVGAKYALLIESSCLEGRSDGDGYIRQKIPAWSLTGRLLVWPDERSEELRLEWALLLGHLDPLPELSAVQARLNNLGYDCGEPDGLNDEQTESAVREFQTDYDLLIDGIVGPQTRGKLEEIHRV